MATVVLPLCEFRLGCHVRLAYDNATGLLMGMRAVNNTTDRVMIGFVRKGAYVPRVKLGAPGETREFSIPPTLSLAAGVYVEPQPDTDPRTWGWPAINFRVQLMGATHSEAG